MTYGWKTVTKDFLVDSNYGDFEISNNDIVTERNQLVILKNVIIERYKTNFNDFILKPNYGANLDRFIGKGMDKDMIENIVFSLKKSLTYDNFINVNDIEIIPIVLPNMLRIFTYITTPNDTLSIESKYDYSEGVFEID